MQKGAKQNVISFKSNPLIDEFWKGAKSELGHPQQRVMELIFELFLTHKTRMSMTRSFERSDFILNAGIHQRKSGETDGSRRILKNLNQIFKNKKGARNLFS